MFHDINLRDHLDEQHNPFEFLCAKSQYDPSTDTDARGNRIRFSEWQTLLGSLPGCRGSQY